MDRPVRLLLAVPWLCCAAGCAEAPDSDLKPPPGDLGAPAQDLLRPDTPPTPPPVPDPCLGFTLYSTPTADGEPQLTALLDMKGQVVRTWPHSGFPSIMLPGGSILTNRSLRPGNINLIQDAVEMIQVSWEGQISWSFSSWDKDGEAAAQDEEQAEQCLPRPARAPGVAAAQRQRFGL